MKQNIYTGNHIHPLESYSIEFVAYEKIDGSWDVFLDEPPESVPELDKNRNAEGELFLGEIESENKLDKFAEDIIKSIADDYAIIPYFKEEGLRRNSQKLIDQLSKTGCHGMFLSHDGRFWECHIRKKDIDIANNILKIIKDS